ncbi:multiple monosaccharide ABC transporter ATP-binding protein [Mycolicibacterium confluentis]|uniref:Xylose ABC transporter ATP-binding protein n=2 Tax=Mycolicibacterium confluentis TaxID=28047 RepID=A0A7I7Y209_9MYCO|nr:xylose ABC transporter ATP-binding protein [Mycolicibacterium confluentis]
MTDTRGTAGAPLLQMRGITKRFGNVTALSDVNLTVRAGEIHAICGENGAGKSTLMKVLSGVYPHGSYQGEITFDGMPGEFKDIRSSERRGIGIIHQELALVSVLSIAENIFLGNEHASSGIINWHETMTDAQRLLDRVGLRESPQTRISDIGVGKQQLVEIAKALSKKVKLLILDEPTAALNDADSAHLLDLMVELTGEGLTCIIISHKLNEVMRVADTVTILRDGQTIETHAVESGLTEEHVIRGMVGRDMVDRFPARSGHPIGEVTLAIEGWTVHHPLDPQRKVVDSVSINVRRGEVVGLAGLMGAGRTELAMSVFGRSYGRKTAGRVVKDGKQIRTRTVPEAIGHGLAYVTEDRKHYGLNLMDDIARSVTLASLQKVSRTGVVNEHEETLVAEGFRTDMQIKAPSVRTTTGSLSGGNQQKVVLSKWVFADPDVLILDEPTRGVDVGAKYEIYTIINRLAAQGKSVIVISSELPELIGLCDRIYTLNEGRVTGEVDRADAAQETLMHFMMKGPTT